MRSALYFPHTQVGSARLIKSSLLLWDNLEYIVPYPEYRPHYENKEIAEAIELIGRPLIPNEYEKRKTHSIIEDFATGILPEPFYYKDLMQHTHQDYEIYPQKLLPETWKMLLDLQLAGNPRANEDYPLAEPAGLSIMSILADCCAGETRSRITDRGLAYATIANLTLDSQSKLDGTREKKLSAHETMVSITLGLLEMSTLPLRKLIDFRKREASERGGYSLTTLRHNYLKRIEDHAKEVSEATSLRDLDELERTFEVDMKNDSKKLAEELWRAKIDAIFSKETLAVLAAIPVGIAAAHVLPFAIPAAVSMIGGPGAVAVGGILSANKYATNRRAILDKHPMAYLYELERHR